MRNEEHQRQEEVNSGALLADCLKYGNSKLHYRLKSFPPNFPKINKMKLPKLWKMLSWCYIDLKIAVWGSSLGHRGHVSYKFWDLFSLRNNMCNLGIKVEQEHKMFWSSTGTAVGPYWFVYLAAQCQLPCFCIFCVPWRGVWLSLTLKICFSVHKSIYVVHFKRKSPGKNMQTLVKLWLHAHSQTVNYQVIACKHNFFKTVFSDWPGFIYALSLTMYVLHGSVHSLFLWNG